MESIMEFMVLFLYPDIHSKSSKTTLFSAKNGL